MPSKTVQIEVPAELLEQLQVFMNAMNIQPQEPAQDDQEPAQDDQETIPEDMEDDEIEVTYQEVKAIVGHQKHPMEEQWKWKIQWTDGTESWVDDSDCDCEDTIRAYMEEKELGNTAYIVCRVSTKEQASSTSLSLEAQLSEIQTGVTFRNGIRTRKFTRVKVCSFAKSAYRNIPDSIRMIGESCRSGDMIFVWRVDRLTRNIEDHLSFIQEINAKNVDIYSHSEGSVTTLTDSGSYRQSWMPPRKRNSSASVSDLQTTGSVREGMNVSVACHTARSTSLTHKEDAT